MEDGDVNHMLEKRWSPIVSCLQQMTAMRFSAYCLLWESALKSFKSGLHYNQYLGLVTIIYTQ